MVILGHNYIISFTSQKVEEIETIKNNFALGADEALKAPIDIFYSIIDRVVDSYTPIIDNFDIQLVKVEEVLFKNRLIQN